MAIGKFEIDINANKIKDIFFKIINEDICKIQQVCERYGEAEDEVRYYNVFTIHTPDGIKILKKTDKNNVEAL